jgi:hypothetical protein
MTSTPLIELHGQFNRHSEGVIALDRPGAEALIEALQRFLENGQAVVEVFASDGEGYDLHLVPMAEGGGARHYLDLYEGWQPMYGEGLLDARKRT